MINTQSQRTLIRKLLVGAALVAVATPFLLHANNGFSSLPDEFQDFIDTHGLTVKDTFQASENVTAAVVEGDQQYQIIYLVEGADQIFIGGMRDLALKDLTQAQLDEYVYQDMYQEVVKKLDAMPERWAQVGADNAPYIYTFDDMNCPYCHRQFMALQPLADAGKLQIRSVVVGGLREDSDLLGARLLSADDPGEMLALYHGDIQSAGGNASEATHKQRLEREVGTPSNDAFGWVEDNKTLMRDVGITGTPGSLLIYPDGSIERHVGAMNQGMIKEKLDI